MADISGVILTVLGLSFKVASIIYNYSRDVKGAKNEIQQLSSELFALIGVLERMKGQQEQLSSGIATDQSKAFVQEKSQESLRRVLQQSIEFLQDLHQRFETPKSRFQAKLQRLNWPFEESETKQHLQWLERVKSYLILSLMTDEIDLTQQIASEISALRVVVQGLKQNQSEEDPHVNYRMIVEWLSPVDADQTRENISQTRISGSGGWFLKDKTFRGWFGAETSSSFWLNGITGAGKTTLITTAIEGILSIKAAKDKVACFYCSFTDDVSLDILNILGSILAQLCNSTDEFEEIRSIYNKKIATGFSKPQKMDVDQLIVTIVQRVKCSGRTFIFIDAVNESNDPDEILACLRSIAKSCDNVYILMSSINEMGIEESVQQMPRLIVHTLHPQDTRSDIDLLVQEKLQNHPRLRHHTPQLKNEITLALTHGADGMFRWVHCQLDLLSRLKTPGAVRKALTALPPTLDKTYESLLSRIDGGEDKELAKQILELLAFSFRPLTLSELCEFLQITPGLNVLDESKCLTDQKDVLSICGSLLNFSSDDRLVTLAHHSVKTYLVSDIRGDANYFRISALEAHRNIAMKCLVYLSLDDFSSGPYKTESEVYGRYQRYPLLDYAAQQWAHHTLMVPDLGVSLWAILKSFLFSADEGRGNFLTWVQLLIPGSKNVARTEPLYYAASFGLTTVVRYLLEAGANVEARGGRCGATPINIASYRGHIDVVKLLLAYGANPHSPDEAPGWNSIDWARSYGYNEILELFYKFESVKFGRAAAQKLRQRWPSNRYSLPDRIPLKSSRLE